MPASDIAIRVEGLRKRFRIGRHEPYKILSEQLGIALRMAFRGGSAEGRVRETHIWALDDVSFEVREGEIVGLVGPNGAGKTTLLKILARITEPTAGHAELHGRVGALLEVGTGFHPELTGRENVFLNGAILGMSKAELRRKFDEIVDFAGVPKFIDTPVKKYSSGMYVRLAFAVAAFLEPEILLVDEVLAVGDAEFQRRCLGKMGEVAAEGRTIIFVSHHMPAITRLCQRGLLLEHGRITYSGGARETVEHYLTKDAESTHRVWLQPPQASAAFLPLAVGIRQRGELTASVTADEPFTIEFEYELTQQLRQLMLQVILLTPDGVEVLATHDQDDPEFHDIASLRGPGSYRSSVEIPGNLLNKGRFVVGIKARSTEAKRQLYFYEPNSIAFDVLRIAGLRAGAKALVWPLLPWTTEQLDSVPAGRVASR